MSILIKGVEMPRKCIRCPVNVYGRCLVNDDKDVSKATADAVRDKDCPLVPVPPHGRLGDLGVLRETFGKAELEAREEYYKLSDAEKECEYEQGVWDGLHMAAKILSTAPTIIPADPAEEGET